MGNTLFSKCEILSDLYNDFYGETSWQPFFDKNNLGIFCAVSHVAGSTILTQFGEADILSAYNSLCNILEVDPNDPYETINEMME